MSRDKKLNYCTILLKVILNCLEKASIIYNNIDLFDRLRAALSA